MSWSLFGTKCGACGKRTRDAVLAPAGTGVDPQNMICKACFARLKSGASARAEAKDQDVQGAKRRAADGEIRVSKMDPASRVHDRGAGTVEGFFAQMSNDLVASHGPLVKAEYLSHYPGFEIRFHYRDGATILSGQRTGKFDIHFLSLGYVGEGPRYAKVFLDAAGCNRTAKEIAEIRPGDVILPGDSKVARFTDSSPRDAGATADALDSRQLTASALGVVCTGLQQGAKLAISPDERFLVFVTNNQDDAKTLRLFSTQDNVQLWSVPLDKVPKKRTVGVGFINHDRLIVVYTIETVIDTYSNFELAISLLNAVDGSVLAHLTSAGYGPSWYRDNGWVNAKHGIALLWNNKGPLLLSAVDDGLKLSHCDQTWCGDNITISGEGAIYFESSGDLCRYFDASKNFRRVARGGNDICVHEDGPVICGGGHKDGSGDCYLSVYDPAAGLGRVFDNGRDPVFEVSSAGPGQVLVCCGTAKEKMALLSFATNQRHWEKPFRGFWGGGYSIIATAPSEGWALVQGRDGISCVSIKDFCALWTIPRVAGEVVHGIWVSKQRHIYLCRYPTEKADGAIECFAVGSPL